MTPLTVPPRRTAKGWQRYDVMTRSSPSMAEHMPTETASWPMARWQKPRMSLALYSMSHACSILRIVVILVYMSIRRFLETSTDVEGGSHRYEWNLAEGKAQKQGDERRQHETPGA